MPVMPVPALQVPPRDEPAGPHPELQVEWMPQIPIADRQARQQPPRPRSNPNLRLILHALNLTKVTLLPDSTRQIPEGGRILTGRSQLLKKR